MISLRIFLRFLRNGVCGCRRESSDWRSTSRIRSSRGSLRGERVVISLGLGSEFGGGVEAVDEDAQLLRRPDILLQRSPRPIPRPCKHLQGPRRRLAHTQSHS